MSFLRRGSHAPSCALAIAMLASTTSVSTPHNRSPYGDKTGGFIRKIREDGSSGIAATTWGGALATMRGRSADGERSRDTWQRFADTASVVIASAARGSAKRCFIGPTTAE